MLRIGDVLVFKAGNNTISKTIAFITKSDVSHAAMVYSENEIVEMGLSGISVSQFKLSKGKDVQVLRFSPEVDPLPLAKAAKIYVDANTRYNLPSLVIIAGYILYHEILPNPKLAKVIDLVIRYACVELDKLIQKVIIKNPDKALVCSQLVHQVYHDCGKQYYIKLKDKSNLDTVSNSFCLVDMINSSNTDFLSLQDNEPLPEINETDLIDTLYDSLTEELEFATNESIDYSKLLRGGKKFLYLLEELLKKSKSDLDIDSLFITPADLAYNTTNLQLVKKVNLKRTY